MDIEITTARNRITDALLNGNESISYRDIEAASMPVFVKAWFHLGVETWYLPEYAHRADWTHFDYADALVQQTQAEYDRAVKGTALFSREACEEIIDGALRHEMAYVKQPVDAVIGILLQRSDAVDGVHVVDFLSQFKREDFYSASLRTYVSEHEDSHLDQDLLKQILRNAERQAYETRPYETFRAAVGAVADMLGIITDNDRADQISGDVWSSFIEFRQIHQLNPVLGETLARLNLQTEQSLTPDELLGTESPSPDMEALASPEESDAEDPVASVYDIPETYKASEEPVDPVEQDTASDLLQDDRLEPSQEPSGLSGGEVSDDDSVKDVTHIEPDEIESSEDDSESEGLDEEVVNDYLNEGNTSGNLNEEPPAIYESPDDTLETPGTSADDSEEETEDPLGDLEDEVDTPAAAEQESVEEKPVMSQDSPIADNTDDPTAAEKEQSEEAQVEQFALANTPRANPKVNLSTPPAEIGKKQEKLFVKKLFNKNVEEYQEVLSRLEYVVSWEEAFSIIEEIWQERGLNLFSKESQEFTGVFYKRYFPPPD